MKRLLAAALLFFPLVAHAAQVALVPTTSTVGIGAQFDVVIQVQAGAEAADSAAGYIGFDHALLAVVSITAGANLPVPLANSYDNGAGTINYSAGTFSNYPTGNFTLATVRFSALAVTGGTPLTFNHTLPRETIITFTDGTLSTSAADGTVVITGATPTPTITPTRTVTLTPTEAPTVTPGGPTATATATPAPIPACCGDCDGDGTVSPSEVQTCTAILAGSRDLSVCPACDCDADGEVLVSDLTRIALNRANGCPGAPEAPLPWTVNPADAPARVVGHLNCKGSEDRACLQTTLLNAHPSMQREGDIWPFDDGRNQKLCFAAGGRRFCCAAVEE